MSLGELVRRSDAVEIRQKREWTEIFTDWETRNRYVVRFPSGEELVAGETGGGFMETLLRGMLKNRRPFTMELREASGQPALRVERPWTWWLSRVEVLDGAGRLIGSVEQEFAFFRRVFRLVGPGGVELGRLTGPFFRPWTFHLEQGGREVGRISKQWGGFFKELATDADTFGLSLGPELSAEARLVALGATFLIDFLYFEDRE